MPAFRMSCHSRTDQISYLLQYLFHLSLLDVFKSTYYVLSSGYVEIDVVLARRKGTVSSRK